LKTGYQAHARSIFSTEVRGAFRRVPCSPLDRRPQLVPCLCSPVECGAVLPTSLLCQGGECGTAVSHPPYFGTLECDKGADVQRNHATSRDMGVGRGIVGTRSNEDRIAAAATRSWAIFFLLLGIGTSVSHLEVGKRQFSCRQMGCDSRICRAKGSRRRAYRFLDPYFCRFNSLPFALAQEIYTPLLEHNMQYRSDKLATIYIAAT
jgi:hypothetical protein